MSRVAPLILLIGLVAFLVAHLVIVVQLARSGAWGRVALALLLPPLAPWWAWERGMRRSAYAWVGALAVYVVGVVVA
ncbi:MAG TPA: hypothetical protein VIF62_00630 [Labilithrix sp.]